MGCPNRQITTFTVFQQPVDGDRYGVVRNDVFQLAGSESGTVGGVNNGWDSFFGGGGSDRIYVAPKSGYYWTAVMIANNGLSGVEQIYFGTSGPKPIYFSGIVNFNDVTSLNIDAKIYGREGNNTFNGGSLGEYVEGDDGNDTMYGYGGNDTLYGDTFDNPWAANYAAAGNDTLRGGDGNDILNGQGGNDALYGDVGNDFLYGEIGVDRLDGGAGTNQIWGGSGSDTFQFTSINDQSVIKDFELGIDRLRFDTGIADEFNDLTILDDANGNAHIVVGAVDITLTGVSSTSVNSSFIDFGAFA